MITKILQTSTSSTQDEKPFSSRPYVQIKFNIREDHRKYEVVGIKVVGGTVNMTCYDSPTYIKGLEENQDSD